MFERDKEGAIIAYQTTQCLTSGIRRVLLRDDNVKDGQSVSWVEENKRGHIRDGRICGTVHLSYAAACEWSKAFRDQRIKKLQEQIVKLQKLSFGEEAISKGDCYP